MSSIVEPATTFRLAGTRVCSLFGRELKGEPFGAIWSPQDAGAASDRTSRTGASAFIGLLRPRRARTA